MLTVALFELQNRLRLISTWVYFLVFGSLAALLVAAAGGYFLDFHVVLGAGRVKVNSPYAIAASYGTIAILGISVISAIMGRSVQQDFEHRTHALLFSTPLSRWSYLGGRYLGAGLTASVVFSSVVIGMWAATYLPGLDSERLGPNRISAYVLPYLYILVPNIFAIGGIFFTLAAVSRRMLPVYVGSVVVLLGWIASSRLLGDVNNQVAAALLDPFGMRAVSVLTRYWPVAERDVRLLPLSGVLLWNRLLWAGVALVILGVGLRLFSFREPVEARGRVDVERPGSRRLLRLPTVQRRGARGGTLDLVLSLAGLYLREIVGNVYFGVLIFAGLGTLAVTGTATNDLYGTHPWPVTALMLDMSNGLFAIFVLAMITFYSGELVWHERDDRLDQIVDATPLTVGANLAAKLIALTAMLLLAQCALIGFGMVWQMAHGYWRFEFGLYVKSFLGIGLIDFWLVLVLAMAIHSVVNHKYVGHLLVVLYYLFISFAPSLGFEDLLYRYGESLLPAYSDMNGFGEALTRTRVLEAYWLAVALFLLCLTYLFWPRGAQLTWHERWTTLRERATPVVIAWAIVSLTLSGAMAGFVYYNTHVLNAYVDDAVRNRWRADYETRYKAIGRLPGAKVAALTVTGDLHPSSGDARMTGTLTIENHNLVPVDEVMLQIAPSIGLTIDQLPQLIVHRLAFDVPTSEIEDNPRFRVWRYRLATPLAPGAHAHIDFDVELAPHGFTNGSFNKLVVANGSFVHGGDLVPSIGYSRELEIEPDDQRRRFGLGPWAHWPARNDGPALNDNLISGPGADWVRYEATVTTDADQVALAPGDLIDEQTQGARRTAHYRIDAPVMDLYALQSGRYALQRSAWGDTAGARSVPIDIYYHPGHTYDLEAMNRSAQDSLDYFSQKFGPYPFSRFRIVEFPRYQQFAESMPTTTPFSEAIGFVARVDPKDAKDVDYPYYVTAHEVAHQWWGQQVIGADVEGGTMLTETLAQYSALMVMKHHFGAARMRRFLAYELDDYLIGRAIAKVPERPLATVEDAPYIYYRKGALAMYALQDYLGEDRVNAVLREFRDRHAFKGPPYPTTVELIQLFRDAAPAEMKGVVDDLFVHIVLFDNHAESATARAIGGGRYEVTMTVDVHKYQVDGDGREKPMALDDLIDIGVLDERGEAIALRREHMTNAHNRFTMIVERKPASAGVDPLNKLISRHPHENTVAVAVS